MKFPLIGNENPVYPSNDHCPRCGKKFDGDFVVFNAGALFGTKDDCGMDTRMFGFASLNSHFDSKDYHHSIYLADSVDSGQFDIMTCSYSCMRGLFNEFFKKNEDAYLKFKKEKKHG